MMTNRREAICTLISTVLAGLGLPGSQNAAEQNDALQSIQYGLNGGKVGSEVADWARKQVTLLSYLDDHLGGKKLYPIAQSNLNLLQNLLYKRAASGKDERELRLATAHATCQAGWFAEDAEQLDFAAQHFRFGIEMARTVNNSEFAAYCLMRLGDLEITRGYPDQGLSYLVAAEREAGEESPLRSVILSYVVWAQGMMGDSQVARRTLGRADTLYEKRDTDRIPEWLYWMTRPSLTDQAPRAFIPHDPRFAAQLLNDGLANIPAEYVRDRMYLQVMLAKSKYAAGDMDEAISDASKVLQTVSTSPMPAIEKHLFQFDAKLPEDPVAKEFKERFADYANGRKLKTLHS